MDAGRDELFAFRHGSKASGGGSLQRPIMV